jgi:hypothetical protein
MEKREREGCALGRGRPGGPSFSALDRASVHYFVREKGGRTKQKEKEMKRWGRGLGRLIESNWGREVGCRDSIG